MAFQSLAHTAPWRFGAGLVGLCGKARDLSNQRCLQSDARGVGSDSALQNVFRKKWVMLR
jgi:hypothetical protein